MVNKIKNHFEPLLKRYLAEKLTTSFEDYLNNVSEHCPTEQDVIAFLNSDQTLLQLVTTSPTAKHKAWVDETEDGRKILVFEARFLLLKVQAIGTPEEYAEVYKHVIGMIGLGIRRAGYTKKRRTRIVGAHALMTHGRFRRRFVKEAIALKGTGILEELSQLYSAIDGAIVTPAQLYCEAEID